MNKHITFPVAIIASLVISQISAFAASVVSADGFQAVDRNTTVFAWGANSFGQSQIPAGLSNVVAVAGGGVHSLALKGDGTVIGWGYDGYGEIDVPAGLSNVIAIAAGGSHSLALRANGTVLGWGLDNDDQAFAPPGLSNVIAIAAGFHFSLALKSDGTVVTWGKGIPAPPLGLNAIAIAAGSVHALALRSDGTVVAWGDNLSGQINVPSDLNNVSAIYAGGNQSLAIKPFGTVVGWGYPSAPPAAGAAVLAVGLGHVIVLKTDGTFGGWGQNTYGQAQAPQSLQGVVTVAAGGEHNLAIQGDPSPFIFKQPVGQAVFPGQPVTLSTRAGGSLPLLYQWQFNGVTITGATNSWLYLPNMQPVLTGNYQVIISNPQATITSASALLQILAAPSIVASPVSQTVGPGSTVTFDVTANGTQPLSYQWQKAGSDIPGANAPTFTIASAQTTDEGDYRVIVSNQGGSATSSAATLTVRKIPVIVTQPAWLTVTNGANVSFTVVATSLEPLSYQWQKGTANLPGQTGPTLSMSSVQLGDMGEYRVLVSNSSGSVFSAPALLTVYAPPSLNAQPFDKTVVVGHDVSFAVVASGNPAPTYQWKRGGVDLPGQTGATLYLPNVQPSQADLYQVLVSNMLGTVASSVVRLTVLVPPTITQQPLSQTVEVGANVRFAVSVNGAGPFTYQWQKGGTPLAGQTAASLLLPNVTPADAGEYRVLVTGALGSATSDAALLVVSSPPIISTQPANLSVAIGDNVTFSVEALGAAPLTYQWQKSGVKIVGATGTTLSLFNVQWTDAQTYRVLVANPLGTVISGPATLTVGGQTEGRLFNSSRDGSTFRTSLITAPSKNYVWEFKNFINDPAWIPLQGITGDGTVMNLTDTTPRPKRFYRVRQ